MANVNLFLPESMQDWIEAQTRQGGFADPGDLIRSLIEREQERSDRIASMQRLVDEARSSGVSDESMTDIRQRALATSKGSG